jgi:lysyl-tRNA synthetase class II
MENKAFEQLKNEFRKADTDRKISIYVDADELTQHQYKELLQMFPLGDLNKLEAALA